MHTVPALGNRESYLGPVFQPIYEFGLKQFQILLCQIDVPLFP